MTKALFDSAAIGSLKLPNRFVRSATWEGLCEVDGRPTPKLVQLYRNLARGGVGLIITGYSYIRADGKQLPGKMGIDSDDLIAPLRELSTAVHEEGGRVFCQLVHAGAQTTAKMIGAVPLAPSALKAPNYPELPRELGITEIQDLVQAFAAAANRAKQAGFDGVQLHGAHGYLINQFLSPLMNRRSDAYGGTLEGRMRFLEEVCVAVRRAVGPHYPVTIKLTAADHLPGGLEFGEAMQIAQRLGELGIDAIEVSSGTAASGKTTPVRQEINEPAHEAYNSRYARRLKEVIDVPILLVGGLRSGTVLQRLLQEDEADFFSFSRPLIREPDFPNRLRTDESYRSTCISCNGCFRPGMKGEGIYCVVDKIEAENRSIQV
ncbi:NADH-dependent flavin oxidoreductase, Oye family [Desulfuromonas sp. DDH964]|uniref:NADH:flavin oxidoreductase n=1 Tax=Desulfuromonas sp. DDH964 TaxID=1823759 RepID=UPI00078C20EB|nr:NADH:flavin oxidoreductase [Desulfuromonas sp. DDH964]AMV72321.1 NADH-dependent flavin oxidoreductase, Oye family [Desulfuromonas sp. DDH964]